MQKEGESGRPEFSETCPVEEKEPKNYSRVHKIVWPSLLLALGVVWAGTIFLNNHPNEKMQRASWNKSVTQQAARIIKKAEDIEIVKKKKKHHRRNNPNTVIYMADWLDCAYIDVKNSDNHELLEDIMHLYLERDSSEEAIQIYSSLSKKGYEFDCEASRKRLAKLGRSLDGSVEEKFTQLASK